MTSDLTVSEEGDLKRVVALRALGKKPEEIAAETGIHVAHVRRICGMPAVREAVAAVVGAASDEAREVLAVAAPAAAATIANIATGVGTGMALESNELALKAACELLDRLESVGGKGSGTQVNVQAQGNVMVTMKGLNAALGAAGEEDDNG